MRWINGSHPSDILLCLGDEEGMKGGRDPEFQLHGDYLGVVDIEGDRTLEIK